TSSNRRLFRVEEPAPGAPEAPPTASCLRLATFNCTTLRGGEGKRPERAFETTGLARSLGVPRVAVQETRAGRGEILDLPDPWDLKNRWRPPLAASNRNPGGGVGWLTDTSGGFPLSELVDGDRSSEFLERLWVRVGTSAGALYSPRSIGPRAS